MTCPLMSLWSWPLTLNPQIQSIHLLVMTNHNTKLEDPWAMSTLVIDRTRFVYWLTDGQTNICKAIYILFFKGGHNHSLLPFLTYRPASHSDYNLHLALYLPVLLSVTKQFYILYNYLPVNLNDYSDRYWYCDNVWENIVMSINICKY